MAGQHSEKIWFIVGGFEMITKETKRRILDKGFFDYIATYYHEHTKEELSTLATASDLL